MKIKEAVYKKCGECGTRKECVSQEVWGCDHHQVCSWTCFAKLIKKIKTDHFISLPFLTFDAPNIKGIMAKDFLKILK